MAEREQFRRGLGSDSSLSMVSKRSTPLSVRRPPSAARIRTTGPRRSTSVAAGRSAPPAQISSRLTSGSSLKAVGSGTGRPRSIA